MSDINERLHDLEVAVCGLILALESVGKALRVDSEADTEAFTRWAEGESAKLGGKEAVEAAGARIKARVAEVPADA